MAARYYRQIFMSSLLLASLSLTACGGGGGSDGSGNNSDGSDRDTDNVIVDDGGEGSSEDNSGTDAGENTDTESGDEENTDQEDESIDNTDEGSDTDTDESSDNSIDNSGDDEDSNNTDSGTDTDTGTDQSPFIGQLVITSEWGSGYGAEIKITNQSGVPLENWQLQCTTSLQISSLWNAEYQLANQQLTLQPVSWNTRLAAGQTLTVGFGANGSLPADALTGCDLSGYAIAFAQVSGESDADSSDNEVEDQGSEGDPELPDTAGDRVALSDLQAAEAALTSGELMTLVRQAIATRDNAVVDAVTIANPANPENVQRVEAILAEADWEYLFPRRAPEYSYRKFLQAVAKFPAFCGDYSDGRDAVAICRKSLATMFAHFTQETGGHTSWWAEEEWRQGLHYLREVGWSEEMANGYGICDPATWQARSWPCATFADEHAQAGQYKSYFGRGAKQLSYNYNYGPFSLAMFGDVNVLLESPDLVADTWLNLASAVFFFVYPQPPKPSMLHVIDGTWQPNANDLAAGLVPGFGVTTQIINGGIECGGSSEHIQSANRISYYRGMADYLGVPVAGDEVLGCAGMQQFDSSGAGALAIYWEQSWTQENACQLVGYQTAYSAFTEGDYVKCVQDYFDVEIVE